MWKKCFLSSMSHLHSVTGQPAAQTLVVFNSSLTKYEESTKYWVG